VHHLFRAITYSTACLWALLCEDESVNDVVYLVGQADPGSGAKQIAFGHSEWLPKNCPLYSGWGMRVGSSVIALQRSRKSSGPHREELETRVGHHVVVTFRRQVGTDGDATGIAGEPSGTVRIPLPSRKRAVPESGCPLN